MKKLIYVLMAIALVGCEKEAKSTEKAQPQQITVEQALDAVLQFETWADQVCYDGNNGWFIHIPKYADNEAAWKWTARSYDYHFVPGNNTWFVTHVGGYEDVVPDVTGLQCKGK